MRGMKPENRGVCCISSGGSNSRNIHVTYCLSHVDSTYHGIWCTKLSVNCCRSILAKTSIFKNVNVTICCKEIFRFGKLLLWMKVDKLNPYDFWLSDYPKSIIYGDNLNSLVELKGTIRRYVRSIPSDIL